MKRYGFVGITVNKDEARVDEVQKILSQNSDYILGRMGIPNIEGNGVSVITLIVKATTDELGSITGKLGKLPGVTVKSGLCKI